MSGEWRTLSAHLFRCTAETRESTLARLRRDALGADEKIAAWACTELAEYGAEELGSRKLRVSPSRAQGFWRVEMLVG